MSFDSKNVNEIENDKLNIKSHLNNSLEAEGISVSEELVLRTLDALRLNEAKGLEMSKDDMVARKPIIKIRHAPTLITVAAAALILVVGLSAFRLISPLGMKSDEMQYSGNSVSNDEDRTTEMYSIKESASKSDMQDYDMKATGDTEEASDLGVIADGKSTNAQEEVKSEDMLIWGLDKEIEGDNGVDDRLIVSEEDTLSFSFISSVEPADVSGIVLVAETTGDMSTISDKDQIQDFYTIMEKYLFMPGREGDTDIQYKLIITSEDRDSQINIGMNSLTVELTHNGATSNSIYIADNYDILLMELKDLITKNK